MRDFLNDAAGWVWYCTKIALAFFAIGLILGLAAWATYTPKPSYPMTTVENINCFLVGGAGACALLGLASFLMGIFLPAGFAVLYPFVWALDMIEKARYRQNRRNNG